MFGLNNPLIEKCIIIGIITVIIGMLTEKILTYYESTNNFLSKAKNSNTTTFILYLFIFGYSLGYIMDLIGFEAYCERKCNEANFCNYSCKVGFKA